MDKETLQELFLVRKLSKRKVSEHLNITYKLLEKYIKQYNIDTGIKPRHNKNTGKKYSLERKAKISASLLSKEIPSKEILDKCLDMYDNGIEKKQIFDIFSEYSPYLIDNYINKYGIIIIKETPYEKSKNTISKKEIFELYHVKMFSLNEISKMYNIPYQHLEKMLEEYNISKRSHGDIISKSMTKYLAKLHDSNISHCFQTEEFKERAKKTKLEKYGTPYPNLKQVSSKGECEVREYMKEITGENFEKYYIGKTEYDMYSKKYNLAIEYCGLYWHCEDNHANPKDRNYHSEKRILAESHGIRLITIFEDEWIERKGQVKGFLKSIVQKNIPIRASKCSVVEISKGEANSFYEKYHIQGKTSNNIIFSLGLMYNDILVASISFSKHHRKNDDSKIVLSRLCFHSDYRIHGGASKLFKFSLERIHCDIISWSDCRWSQGNVYEKLGFKCENILKSDYSYVRGTKRYAKQSMKKGNIGASKRQTEYERAKELGYSRIWDCGKKVWIYRK